MSEFSGRAMVLPYIIIAEDKEHQFIPNGPQIQMQEANYICSKCHLRVVVGSDEQYRYEELWRNEDWKLTCNELLMRDILK